MITQKVVFQLKGHTGWVTDVSFSPDGRWLASSSYDQSVIIWDMQTGKEEFRWSTLTTVMTVISVPIRCGSPVIQGQGRKAEKSVWEALTGTNRLLLPNMVNGDGI